MSHHPQHALPTIFATPSCPCKPWGHLGQTQNPPWGAEGQPRAHPSPPQLTVVVTPKGLVLGGVGVEVTELHQVPDPVAEGADGQVLGREGLDVFHLAGA